MSRGCPRDPRGMAAGEINRELDALDRRRSENARAFIAAGRGAERPSDYEDKDDPLSREARAVSERQAALRAEVERRWGPGAPARLPRGFRGR